MHLLEVTLFSSIHPVKISTSAPQLTKRQKKADMVTHWVWKLKAVLWSLFLVQNCKYFSK